MNQREKLLLLGFLGVLAVWMVLKPLFSSFVLDPITERRDELAGLERQVQLQEAEELSVARRRGQLRMWTVASLPPNPVDAQRLYLEWLSDLVEVAGLDVQSITPGTTFNKGSTYTYVQVDIEGRATLDQLCRFLYLFHRAGLLHRITSIGKMDSEDNVGDPLLSFRLTAEGLALSRAPDRRRLFPETHLAADLDAESRTLVIEPAQSFPTKGPFRIRIGSEYMTVTKVAGGQWTVERAVDLTAGGEHPAGATVELAHINRALADRTPEFYRSVVEDSPFTIPQPPIEYRPRLNVASQTVERGRPWEFTVQATGLNLRRGQASYALGSGAPQGMTIEPATGRMSWNPGDDQPSQQYATTVIVTQGDSDRPVFEGDLSITLRDPNEPPTIEAVAPQTVFLGRPLDFEVVAHDERTPDDRLRFSLGDGAPAGATIDAGTGAFRWTPDLSLPEGVVEVAINVTDDGEPAMTATHRVPVNVRFDNAAFTFYDGFFSQGADREGWLRDRSSNQRWILRPGDTFAIADINAYVLEIDPDFLVLLADEATWKLPMGENLRALEKRQAAAPVVEQAAPAEAVEAPRPEDG